MSSICGSQSGKHIPQIVLLRILPTTLVHTKSNMCTTELPMITVHTMEFICPVKLPQCYLSFASFNVPYVWKKNSKHSIFYTVPIRYMILESFALFLSKY